MSLILIDTNVIVRRLRGAIEEKAWIRNLAGRAPVISPITVHELRRGVRPGSPWEADMDRYPAPLVDAPTAVDWVEAADLIRRLFWNTHKGHSLMRLQNDALIAITAKKLSAELWSKDGDMRILCDTLGIRLFVD